MLKETAPKQTVRNIIDILEQLRFKDGNNNSSILFYKQIKIPWHGIIQRDNN